MIKPRLNKIIDFLIDFFYLGIIFFVPLYFSIIPKTNNVFELNKVVFFRIFLLSTLFLYVVKIFFDFSFYKKTLNFIQRKYLFFLIPLLYLLVLFLINLFSLSFENSFWGSYDRQMGVYTFIFLFIFFIVSLIYLDRREKVFKTFFVISLSAFFVSLYGILQALGIDFLSWSESTQARVFSTIGQPNSLASYLLLVFPSTFYFFWIFRKRIWGIFFLFSGVLQIFCLIFTYSRAAQLGLIFGLIVLLCYFFFYKKDFFIFRLQKKTYFILIILLFLSGILFWSMLPEKQQLRLKWIFNLERGGTAARWDYWQASYQAFKQKPLFGYGLENQKDALVKYYEKDWSIFNGANIAPDRAHNFILDCLLTGGIIGLIFYLCLILYFLYIGKLNLQDKKNEGISLVIIFSIICYFFSLLFGFSVVVTEIYLWLYFAMLTSLFLLKYREKNEDNFSEEKKYFFIFTKILIAFIFALGLFLQLKQEIKTIVADHYFYQIKSELNKNNYFTAYLLYDWLIELEVRHYYYNLNFGGALARLLNNEIDETWSRGAQQLILPRIVGEIDRDNYNSFCARALIYTAMASQDKKDVFVKAKKEFDACIERSPGLPRNYFELAKFYFKKVENDKAKETLSIFLSKLPALEDKRLNEEHKFTIKYEMFLAYSLWGDIYLAEENYDQARELYEYCQDLIDRDKEFVFINRKIADSFYREGEPEKAIMILKENINVEGSNYFWYFLIAKIYSELDENLQALEYANQALELDSDNQEIKSLIFSLSK